jgi:DNA-binding MarR family transcriptional regulator
VTEESDLVARVFPRLTQLGAVVNRSRLVEEAQRAADPSLDRPGLGVLITLRTAGSSLRIGEIAERQQVAGPHVTRTVTALEQRGMVRRVVDPADHRARLVELSDAGTAVVERYLDAVLRRFTGALADWSEQDRRELGRLLEKLADDITAHLGAPEETSPDS